MFSNFSNFKNLLTEVQVKMYSVVLDDFDIIFVQLLSTFGA